MALVTKTALMDVSKMSDDDIQDLFTETYEEQVAKENRFDSYECVVKRQNFNKNVCMEVTVIGMAGSPTIDEYKSGKVKNAKSVSITRKGKGTMRFNLDPSSIVSLNTNDYLVVYKA